MSRLHNIEDMEFGYDSERQLYTWKKGRNYRLSQDYTTYEFECRCDIKTCEDQIVSKELIIRLQTLRDQMDEPIRINSGYRCKEHQEILSRRGFKTAKKSMHLVGGAVDIQPARGGSGSDNSARFAKFLLLCEAQFEAIGIAKGWLHVDIRDDKKRRWTY